MKRLFPLLITLLGACAPQLDRGPSEEVRGSLDTSPPDVRVAFWQQRLERDREDSTPAKQLAGAHISKARATGDFDGYIKAEELLLPYENGPQADYSLLTLLASAKAAQHKFREAVQLAERARAINPSDGTAYALLADAQLELGNLHEAERSLDRLSAIDPGFPSLTRRANIRVLEGDIAGALALLRRALDDATSRNLPENDRAWAHIRIGALNYDTGRYEDASRHYRAAEAITPGHYLVMEHMAELAASEGSFDRALALYEKVVALAPTPEFFEALGGVYEALGKEAEAREYYSKAGERALQLLERGDIGYYRYLAEYYSDISADPEKAVFYAEKDLGVRGDPHTFATLAWALYRANRLDESTRALSKALEPGLKDASLFCRASRIYAASGDTGRAKRYREDAFSINRRMSAEECDR